MDNAERKPPLFGLATTRQQLPVEYLPRTNTTEFTGTGTLEPRCIAQNARSTAELRFRRHDCPQDLPAICHITAPAVPYAHRHSSVSSANNRLGGSRSH